MIKKSFLLSFLLISVLLLGGCSLDFLTAKKQVIPSEEIEQQVVDITLDEPVLSSGSLKKFRDYDEVKEFLSTHSNEVANYAMPITRGGMEMNMVFTEASSVDLSVQKTSAINDDYSRTNVQVEGVDEADIIKTDGQYIYALVYNDLYIIKANPAEQTQAVAKLPFPDRPQEIYISDDRLIVIGADSQIMKSNVYKKFARQSPYTFVKIFDVSKPEDATQIRDLNFEGNYQNSRLIDGRLYLIMNNYSQYFANEPVAPRLIDGGKILPNRCLENEACFAPDVYYFDADYDSYTLTSINTIDLRKADEPVSAQMYLLNGAQNIYASTKNIYITYTQYLNEIDVRTFVLRDLLLNRLSDADKALLLQIESLDEKILNQNEKRQKLLAIFQRFLDAQDATERALLETEIESAMQEKYKEEANNWERSMIYKFSLSDGAPVYRAQGFVPGTILNQFSLDEDEAGRLRIATTRSRNVGNFGEQSESYSNLYVLGSDLKTLGSVEKLAPGERIYSVRFLANRAYLVTFKQVDPLFVVDLSTPNNPRLLGELKIPGFSTYLHPYDENTLIGLGRDVQTDVYGNVRNGGIKLSLFDVTNPASPQELDVYIAGSAGSESVAMYNHKAFLFSKEKDLLVIPASLTNTNNSYRPYFSGALVFSLANKQFNLRAEIDHSDNGRYQKYDNWCGYACYDNSVQRSLYIQNALFTFSNKYLKVNDLGDLNVLQSVKLLEDTEKDLQIEPLLPTPIIEVGESSNIPVSTNEETAVGPIMPEEFAPEPFVESPILDENTSSEIINDNDMIEPDANLNPDLTPAVEDLPPADDPIDPPVSEPLPEPDLIPENPEILP